MFYDKAIAKVGWETYYKKYLQYKDQVVCTRRESDEDKEQKKV